MTCGADTAVPRLDMVTTAHDEHFDLDETAGNYRRFLEPYLFTPWAVKLVQLAGIEAGQVVLDVAAGTGAVTRAAASAVGKSGEVIACDISQAMLSWVERRSVAGMNSAPITTLQCSADSLDVPDGSVDVVVCQQGFQFMTGKATVADEFFRVLRPGGSVALAVWSAGAWIPPLDDYEDYVRSHVIGDSIVNVLPREQFRMSPRSIASFLADAGFVDLVARDEHLTVRWPSPLEEARGILGSPFGRRILQLPAGEQDAIIAQLAHSCGGDRITTAAVAIGLKPSHTPSMPGSSPP